MSFRAFQHNYHDGSLVDFRLGPRRELTLEVELDPIWNSEAASARVRFGGIENYDEVVSFFDSIPKSGQADEHIAGIIGLKFLAEMPNWVILDLDHYGDIAIHSKHVTEG
jgi:hypothetical protein